MSLSRHAIGANVNTTLHHVYTSTTSIYPSVVLKDFAVCSGYTSSA